MIRYYLESAFLERMATTTPIGPRALRDAFEQWLRKPFGIRAVPAAYVQTTARFHIVASAESMILHFLALSFSGKFSPGAAFSWQLDLNIDSQNVPIV